MARAAFTVLIINLISRLLGFVRDAVIAREFGASGATDAYLVAYTLPYSLQAILGMAFLTVMVPVVTGYFLRGEEEEGWKVVSSMINGTALVLGVITVLGIIFAPQLIRIMAPGFSQEKVELTAYLSRIMFPSIVFMAIGMLLTGVLNAGKIFAVPAFAPAFANIIVILTVILLGAQYRIEGLAMGTLAGFVGFLLIQIPSLAKIKFRYYFKFDYKHPVVGKLALAVVPVSLSIAVNQILLALNRFFASSLSEGSITALDFADRLMNLPLGIFVAAVSTAIFPVLAEEASRKEEGVFAQTVTRGLGAVTVAMLPAAMGLIVLSTPVIQLLFQRGAFDYEATRLTAIALSYFSLGLWPIGANTILTKAFYALGDLKTPLLYGGVSIGVNIGLSFLLLPVLGHGGLALANSLAAVANMILLFVHLQKIIPSLKLLPLVDTTLKSLAAALIMAVVVFFLTQATNGFAAASTKALLIQVILASGIGALVYFGLVLVLQVDEGKWLWERIAKKV